MFFADKQPNFASTYRVYIIGGFAKRAHPARARYLNVNLARRNRDLQPGGKEIEGGGRGGAGEKWELVEQAYVEYGKHEVDTCYVKSSSVTEWFV